MNGALLSLILLVTATFGVPALADATLYATCAACHGERGQGQDAPFAPQLAGQNAAYLTEQMHNFRNGSRGAHPEDTQGQIMLASSVNLTDGAIASLASFLASLPPENPEPESGDVDKGEQIYRENCLACHGVSGEGVEPIFTPNLRILSASYISRQLEAYRKGWRGNSDTGTARSKNMRSIVPQLDHSDDIRNLIAYLTQ